MAKKSKNFFIDKRPFFVIFKANFFPREIVKILEISWKYFDFELHSKYPTYYVYKKTLQSRKSAILGGGRPEKQNN